MSSARACLLIVLILMFSSAFYAFGEVSVQGQSSDDWLGWARVAWRYYQPGVGVNPSTGLHYARSDWHRFTDWDLGIYVHAILNAERLGLVARQGVEDWGVDFRLEKVLRFLETRSITPTREPYMQYEAETGNVPSDIQGKAAHPSDFGRLLLALDDLRRSRPDLASRIQSIVARYDCGLITIDNWFAADDMYPFYASQGFHAFGFATPKLKDLKSLGGGSFVDVYGELIPKAWVTSEPLLAAVLGNRISPLYNDYCGRVFRAQEKRYRNTGVLTTFSEGVYPAPHYYVYQWVVISTGETWCIYAANRVDGPAVVYTKIAFAFHAIYRNEYTATLMGYVSRLQSSGGFYEGVMDNDRSTLPVLCDKTNGMILEAAGYALQGPIPEFRAPIAILAVVLVLTILAARMFKRKAHHA